MGECFCHTRYLDIKAIHHILWLGVSAIPVTLKKRETPYRLSMGELFCHTRYLENKVIHCKQWVSVSAIPVNLDTHT